jgi:hypothetical protein
MIIAFGLLWIPYVSDLGELIAFIGVVFLWLGRSAFGPAHGRSVSVGTVCVVLGFLVGIVVGLSYVAGVVYAATTPGETLSAFITAVQSSLTLLFASAIAVTLLTSGGYLALPYSLADQTSRLLLAGGLAISVAISVGLFVFLTPQISAALAQATSSGTINLAPISALETKETLWDLLQIVPNMMFLLAYYRTREQTFPPPPVHPEPTPLQSQYGRIDPKPTPEAPH